LEWNPYNREKMKKMSEIFNFVISNFVPYDEEDVEREGEGEREIWNQQGFLISNLVIFNFVPM
jgi:hypothetical protein